MNYINILESVFILFTFYSIYRLILRKETFFKLNRIYLLGSLLFSVTIPFLDINMVSLSPAVDTGRALFSKLSHFKQNYYELNAAIIYGTKSGWGKLNDSIFVIYMLGVLITSVIFATGFTKIGWLIIQNKAKKYGKYSIIETTKITVPFSLFKWIIINPENYSSKDVQQVIEHEKVHVFQLHSLDLVFIEVLAILFWFNPFIYWYRKSIREVHEFLADEAVVENGLNRKEYQKLLLNQVMSGNRLIGLTNRFSYSLSKNRLKMLTMMKSNKNSKTKIVLVIPFVIAFFIFFTNSADLVKASVKNENKTIQDPEKKKKEPVVEGEIFFVVATMPKFEGQDPDAFRLFIQNNLKYPEEAHKNNIDGKVYVSFVVTKEGYIANVKIERGVAPSLDEEAMRVVKLSPKWEPGIQNGEPVNVQFTFPIIFKLN